MADVSALPLEGLWLVRCNGKGGAPMDPCPNCKAPRLHVEATAGLRVLERELLPVHRVCTNKRGSFGFLPCPEALKAKFLLEVLERRATS